MVAHRGQPIRHRNRVPVRASARVRPYPGGPYGAVRVRRPPQRGEVVAVQRAGRRRRAGRALRLRDHRPERRRGPGPRPPPRRPRRDEPEPATSCPPPCSSSTSAAWSPAPARARASATSSSATSARPTPSCSCCGPSSTTTCPGPSDPLEHLGVVELELTYADLETVENQIEKRRKAAKGDKSLVDEVAALEQAKADPRDRHPDLPLRPQGRRPRGCSSRTSCSPTGR